jgi:hypothetical protein
VKKQRFPSISVIALILIVGGLVMMWLNRPRVPEIAEECRSRYERIYAFDEPRFTMAFGYKDARPARFVGDRYERALMAERLLAECPEGAPQGACGFERDAPDSDVFRRMIVGPDGRPRRIRLELLHAAAGPDDQDNRTNPHQKWLSEYAESRFQESIRKSTVVLYNGHSRVGGGPDFSPPLINSEGTILYSEYKLAERELKNLLKTLNDGATEVEVLGLLSCASSQLFDERLRQAKRSLAVWSSRELLYFADALDDSWSLLDALLKMKCRTDFERIAETRPNQAGSKMIGFYEN